MKLESGGIRASDVASKVIDCWRIHIRYYCYIFQHFDWDIRGRISEHKSPLVLVRHWIENQDGARRVGAEASSKTEKR